MPVDPVIIKLQLDDSDLQANVDKLATVGDIDAKSAETFKKTNEELAKRPALIDDISKSTIANSAGVTQQQAVYNKLAASVKDLFGASRDAANQLLKLSAEELTQGLKDKGVTVDELVLSLKGLQAGTADATGGQQILNQAFDDGDAVVNRLTTQLNLIKNELAALGPLTSENAAQFASLAAEGGHIQQELQQTRGVIKDLGSESPILTATTQVIRGLTGAFQAGAAAVSIFGEDNKDLQETMLKVFQITSLVQGIQETLNLVNSKGAFTVLQLAISNKAAAINTQLLAAAESENIIVSTAATVAQKALNLAMSLNPVGIFVIALTAAIGVLTVFASRSRAAKEEEEALNNSLAQNALLVEHINNLNSNQDQLVAQLNARNAKESEITKAQADHIRGIIADRNNQITADQKLADDIQDKINSTSRSGQIKKLQKDLDDVTKTTRANTAANDADFNKLLQTDILQAKQFSEEQLQIARDEAAAKVTIAINGSRASFAAQRLENNAQLQLDLKQAGDNQGKLAAASAKFAKQARDIDAAQAAADAQDRITQETTQLLKIQVENRRINTQIATDEDAQQKKILQTETDAKIAALQKESELDLTITQVNNDKIANLRRDLQLKLEQIDRDSLNRQIVQANEGAIARNKVILAGITATNKERERLEIENVSDQTAIDVRATNLTEDQRREIIAKSEEQIRQIKNAAIIKESEDAITFQQQTDQAGLALLQRTLDAQTEIRAAGTRKSKVASQLGVPILNVDEQLAGIDAVTKAQTDAVDARIAANFKIQQSDEDGQKNFAALQAERLKIVLDGEDKKRGLVKGTAEYERQQTLAVIAEVGSGASKIIGFLDQVFQAQDQAEQQRLDAKKQRIQDELDAGNISAKEAAKRNKEADAEQKKLQVEQAKRQKEIALFTAIINTASAIAVALTGGPILGVIDAAITAAIGIAQIALIASTPLPTFSKGKNQQARNNYQGWGIIGEDGGELWKSGSQMKYADKQTIVWLKKDDVVYTPAQTREMMLGPSGHMNASIPTRFEKIQDRTPGIDYNKLGDAIAKRPLTLSIDGYKEFIKSEQDFIETLNYRRSWNK